MKVRRFLRGCWMVIATILILTFAFHIMQPSLSLTLYGKLAHAAYNVASQLRSGQSQLQ